MTKLKYDDVYVKGIRLDELADYLKSKGYKTVDGINIGRNNFYKMFRHWHWVYSNSTKPTYYARNRGFLKVEYDGSYYGHRTPITNATPKLIHMMESWAK